MKLDPESIKTSLEEMQTQYNFDPQIVLEIIKSAIKTAYKKDYLPKERKAIIHVSINAEGEVQIFREYNVVESADDIEDDVTDITRADAQERGSPIDITSSYFADVTPQDLSFSRIGAQAAAQTVKQQIKQMEKQRFYDKFQDKQGDILKGKVIKTFEDSVVLDIEKTSVILPPQGQIPNKTYHPGEDVWVLLRKIEKGAGGIVLDITQSSPDFVRAVLYDNIPELQNEQVEIMNITRMAGIKTKVLVRSLDERVDPIGVFIGQYGVRIESLQYAMGGERLDFIEYSEDLEVFLKNAFKPVHIHDIFVDGDNVTIHVDPDKKAMAIGKRASNVRLIGQLVDYHITVE